MSVESSLNFEFEAPQYVESWDKVTSLNDGADDFFDAVGHLERDGKGEVFPHDGGCAGIGSEDDDRKQPSISLISRIAREQENLQSLEFPLIDLSGGLVNTSRGTTVQIFLEENHDENGTRRRSLKRKFSPLSDRNESVARKAKIAKDKVVRLLPTVAESPVLLTKGRKRTCHHAEPAEERKILRPKRRVDLGGYIRPVMPKPPTIPEPFNLTESGRHVPEEKSENISHKQSSPFSFYERDKEIMRRKQERLNPPTQGEKKGKVEFKAREATVLRREPFWPEVERRQIEMGVGPSLATEERAEERKKFEQTIREVEERNKLMELELKKVEEEAMREYRKTLEFKARSIKK